MKKIILNQSSDEIKLSDVPEGQSVFSKKNGKLVGMVIKEDSGWVLRIGGANGVDGFHKTRELCMKSGLNYGHEFFTE